VCLCLEGWAWLVLSWVCLAWTAQHRISQVRPHSPEQAVVWEGLRQFMADPLLCVLSCCVPFFLCFLCVPSPSFPRPTFKDLLPRLEWYLQLTRDFPIEQLELPLRSTAPME
jgi:hypothetical protein